MVLVTQETDYLRYIYLDATSTDSTVLYSTRRLLVNYVQYVPGVYVPRGYSSTRRLLVHYVQYVPVPVRIPLRAQNTPTVLLTTTPCTEHPNGS